MNKYKMFFEASPNKKYKGQFKEAIYVNNKDQAFEAISEGVRFIYNLKNKAIFEGYVVNAIIDGLKPEAEEDEKRYFYYLKLLISLLKKELLWWKEYYEKL